MYLNELQKEIRVKKIRQGYLLYGEDEGFIKETINDIRKAIGINEEDIFSYVKHDGQKLTLEELSDSIMTLPFMSDRKLVEIVRADFLSGEKSYKNSTEMIKLTEEFFKDPPEGTFLILYYITSLERKDTKIKGIEKVSHKDKTVVLKMPNLKKEHIGDFINDYMKEESIVLDRVSTTYIKETFEGNILQLRNDLDKIVSYSNGENINKEVISKLLTKSSSKHKYDLVELVFQGKSLESIELYNDLVFKRVEPSEILETIGSRLREAYNYKVKTNQNKPVSEIMKDLGEKFQWLYEKKLQSYSNINLVKLDKLFTSLINAEERFKGSPTDPKREVELLILSFCSIINGNIR